MRRAMGAALKNSLSGEEKKIHDKFAKAEAFFEETESPKRDLIPVETETRVGPAEAVTPAARPVPLEVERPKLGRPAKAESERAKTVSVTFSAEERRRFETLQNEINDMMPVDVNRTELVRVALSMLFEMGPQDVIKRMIQLKKEKR